jgi:hypothetical protein
MIHAVRLPFKEARSLKIHACLNGFVFVLSLVAAGMIQGCGGGGGSASHPAVNPPAGLSFSEPVITATMNQAITADVPAVTGTVSSYSVSPELPQGLSLGATTGVISGTPTAVAAKASYTVSALNSAGSTSASIQITVSAPLPPPTGLMYPQTTIATYVGQTITPDIPGAAGTITSYTVSPALPPGLTMDPSTGVISGTPIAAVPETTYDVVGSNSSGKVTAAVSPTITVTDAPSILLQLGDQYPITNMQFVNSRVLSQEFGGGWTLRNYTSGAIVASGDARLGQLQSDHHSPAQMAGSTLAIQITGGIQVLSSADGHPLSTIASPGYNIAPNSTILEENDSWQLASDGSYIVVETHTGLYVYTPGGQLLFSRPGNYMQSAPFAAGGQVLVANGPAGTNTIETISVPSGNSTVSAPYQGNFYAWFTDGGRFFTTAGGLVFTYSSSGVQQAAVQLPTSPSTNIGGAGNWIWTFDPNSLNVYAIGSTTPALTVSGPDVASYAVSGTTIAVLPFYKTISVIDLSGVAPVETDYPVPVPLNHAAVSEESVGPFAAVSGTEWVAGMQTYGSYVPNSSSGARLHTNVILDGPSLSTNSPRYLGSGAALNIAGSSTNVAISTAIGQISYFNPAVTTPEGSIDLTSGELALSTDGSILAASAQDGSLLNIYSLPAGAVSSTFTYSGSAAGLLADFTLSGSGTTFGQIEAVESDGTANYTLQVAAVAGGPAIWSSSLQNLFGSILLSPDGTLIAVTTGTLPSSAVTIYKNGQQVAAVAGMGIGWIDNGRLLVNNYGYQGISDVPSYINCTIYSPTGTAVASPPLPQLLAIQPVTSDTVFAPAQSAIYSLTTGKATWTNPYTPDSGNSSGGRWIGAVAGPYVVFELEGRVVAVNY